MKSLPYVLGFGFILSVTAATAQTTPAAQQPQTPPVNPTTPANNVGDGAQTKSGTPATPTGTNSPATNGGVAGSAASSGAAQTPEMPSTTSGVGTNPMENSDLQGQIQNALSKEPTITGDPHVTVTGDTVELAGTVGSNKEKITATRIVQSYTGSKKLVNNLTITGTGRDDKNSIHTTSPNGGAQPISAPTNNPEPQKGNAPSATKPPQQ